MKFLPGVVGLVQSTVRGGLFAADDVEKQAKLDDLVAAVVALYSTKDGATLMVPKVVKGRGLKGAGGAKLLYRNPYNPGEAGVIASPGLGLLKTLQGLALSLMRERGGWKEARPFFAMYWAESLYARCFPRTHARLSADGKTLMSAGRLAFLKAEEAAGSFDPAKDFFPYTTTVRRQAPAEPAHDVGTVRN